MENKTQTEGKTSTESIGVTEMQKVEITTAVGHSSFTIPNELPKVVYLDIYGKSYKFYKDGTFEEDEEGGSQ